MIRKLMFIINVLLGAMCFGFILPSLLIGNVGVAILATVFSATMFVTAFGWYTGAIVEMLCPREHLTEYSVETGETTRVYRIGPLPPVTCTKLKRTYGGFLVCNKPPNHDGNHEFGATTGGIR